MTNDETPISCVTYEELMNGAASRQRPNMAPCIEILNDMMIQETDLEIRKEIEIILREVLDQNTLF